jgi:hypothetical protein
MRADFPLLQCFRYVPLVEVMAPIMTPEALLTVYKNLFLHKVLFF